MRQSSTLAVAVKIADIATQKILTIYNTDFKVDYKSDQSPITVADLVSHHVIIDGLRDLTPEIPVLSEEGAGI
jgi:3'(2'), 5'-bisphosphate nucleotidase